MYVYVLYNNVRYERTCMCMYCISMLDMRVHVCVCIVYQC